MRVSPALVLLISMAQFAESQQSSQQPPLNETEKRLVLGQLLELKSCRQETAAYKDYLSRETELVTKERVNYERALDLEKQATALAQKERDLAQDKENFYEQAYRTVTKKPGKLCQVVKVITLGLAQCH